MGMDAELERLIDGLLSGMTCSNCGAEFVIQANRLSKEGAGVYTTPHSCPECEAAFKITVEDDKQHLKYEADRTDIDDDRLNMFSTTQKEMLHEQTHPIRDLVEGFRELGRGLEILQENKERITKACETFRDGRYHTQGVEYDRRVNTDLHNYLASAYTFNQVRQTVEPNIPTDGPVEESKDAFEDEERLILGLRVYAQHNLSLPFRYAQFVDENTGRPRMTLSVDLDEISVIEADADTYGPDGYKMGSDHHYEKVEGGKIDIERRIKLHYDAAVELVETIGEHAEAEYGDDLEDYRESTALDTDL